ncbi:pentapeptide repeat-containing protein [Paenibacillus sp. TRM 82003]|nr:pentapeptide repeat-containing protein [Paenibacillus sp. TRM 82003]
MSITEPIELHADCERCFGLCCVALPFAASADFAADKDAGTPCAHLRTDYRCGIHTELRARGYKGCTVYDCFGAGQRLSQVVFAGADWRQRPETARLMFDALPVLRLMHELLWYLREALALPAARPLQDALRAATAETERLAALDVDALLALDASALRVEIGELLRRVSELARASAAAAATRSPKRPRKAIGRGADMLGAKLRGADLRGANLRGALLIAADLRDADLRSADLLGADLRDTDLRGADLTGTLFLIQAQVNAAIGDGRTKLPSTLARPSHWGRGDKRSS